MIAYNPNALLQIFGENITYQYRKGEETTMWSGNQADSIWTQDETQAAWIPDPHTDVVISAIVSIGETNKTGNGLNTIGTSSFATIDVAIADVPNPSVMDRFVIRNDPWKFVRSLNTDGIMQKIQISKDTRHR